MERNISPQNDSCSSNEFAATLQSIPANAPHPRESGTTLLPDFPTNYVFARHVELIAGASSSKGRPLKHTA